MRESATMSNPLAGNSVDNNGKRTKLPALATVAMLLVSAMSFAAFAAITPAFAIEDEETTSTEQLIAQIAGNIISADGNVSDVTQKNVQIAKQIVNDEGNVTQDIAQITANIIEGGNVTGASQSNVQIASQSSGELLEDGDNETED
jgi:hypothetical protein